MPSTSKIKTTLLKKLATLCGVAAGALSAAPAFTQTPSPQVNSLTPASPIIVPLSNEDPSSNLNSASQPIFDTITPTTTAPMLSVTPVTTSATPLATPYTDASTSLTAPQAIAPTTSTMPQTFSPSLSATPTTLAPTPTAVLQPTGTSTIVEVTPGTPITSTP